MWFRLEAMSNYWRLTGYTGYHGNFDYAYLTFYEAAAKMKSLRKTANKYD